MDEPYQKHPSPVTAATRKDRTRPPRRRRPRPRRPTLAPLPARPRRQDHRTSPHPHQRQSLREILRRVGADARRVRSRHALAVGLPAAPTPRPPAADGRHAPPGADHAIDVEERSPRRRHAGRTRSAPAPDDARRDPVFARNATASHRAAGARRRGPGAHQAEQPRARPGEKFRRALAGVRHRGLRQESRRRHALGSQRHARTPAAGDSTSQRRNPPLRAKRSSSWATRNIRTRCGCVRSAGWARSRRWRLC